MVGYTRIRLRTRRTSKFRAFPEIQEGHEGYGSKAEPWFCRNPLRTTSISRIRDSIRSWAKPIMYSDRTDLMLTKPAEAVING